MTRRYFLAALAVAAITAALVGPAAIAGGKLTATTWTVNDNHDGKGKCKTPTVDTIQAAVDAATAGDLIVVCPGTYGATTVDKALTITGAGKALKAKQCADPVKSPANGADATVVTAPGAAAFAVSGDDVQIAGVTIQGSDIGVQVTGDAVANTRVSDSVLQDNTMGVYLRGQGLKFTGNCVRTNNRAGSASGNGMYTDPGPVFHGGAIKGNVFVGNSSSAINLNGDGNGSITSLLITENKSTGDSNFVSAAGIWTTQITHNDVPETSGGSAVFLQAANFDVKVLSNTLSKGEEGVAINSDGDEPNTAVVVAKNSLNRNGIGVVVAPESLFNGLIYKNTMTENEFAGVAIFGPNYVQVINNKLNGNGEVDCFDTNSPGEITLWFENTGDTELQDGLCDGATVVGP